MHYKNSNLYRGLWKNGMKNGKGIYVKDNKIFIGFWTDDTLNKNVITQFVDSNDKYIGEMSEWLFNGKGQYYFLNGEKYMGDFKEGLFHGKGTYYCGDEIVYNGDYLHNERTGKGVIYYNSSSDLFERYEGDIVKEKHEGKANCIIRMDLFMKENSKMVNVKVWES